MKRTLLVVVLLTAALLVAFLCHTPTVRVQEAYQHQHEPSKKVTRSSLINTCSSLLSQC